MLVFSDTLNNLLCPLTIITTRFLRNSSTCTSIQVPFPLYVPYCLQHFLLTDFINFSHSLTPDYLLLPSLDISFQFTFYLCILRDNRNIFSTSPTPHLISTHAPLLFELNHLYFTFSEAFYLPPKHCASIKFSFGLLDSSCTLNFFRCFLPL